jgi:glutathione S-transferase
MAPQYKLIYFDLKGMAENTRMLFALAGQQYEDVRVSFDDWPSIKETFPFHLLPVLDVSDEGSAPFRLAQSHAIERFVANRFNLLGKTEIERAKVDMIGEQVLDTYRLVVDIHKKPDSDEKWKELDETIRVGVPYKLALIQKQLEANSSGYLVGDCITLVDLQLLNFYDWLRERRDEVLDKLPTLKRHYQLVTSHPVIAEHLKRNAHVRLTILMPH